MGDTFFVTSKHTMQLHDMGTMMREATYAECGTLLTIGKTDMNYRNVYAFDTDMKFNAQNVADMMGMKIVSFLR